MSSQARRPLGVLMRRYALEGAVLGLATLVIVALGARLMPVVYESTAMVEASGGAPPAAERPDGELQKQIQEFAEAPEQVVLISTALRREGDDLASSGRALAGAANVTAVSKTRFAVSFRAGTAERARDANSTLVAALVKSFGTAGAGVRDEKAVAALEAATKELAAFVAAHPKDLGDAPAPPSTLANEAAIANLRKERATVEAQLEELNKAAGAESPVARENPYAEPEAPANANDAQRTKLQRRLVEIKNSIAGLQKESAQRSEASRKGARGSDDEWQKRARAVADAQKAVAASMAAAAAAPPLRVQMVQPPSLPAAPIKSQRGIVTVAGGLLGLTVAALWTFLRANARRGRRRRASSTVRSSPPVQAPPLQPAEPARRADAPVAPEARPVTSPVPVAGVDPAQPLIPKAPPVPNFSAGRTQIGMADPAVFKVSQQSPVPPGPGGFSGKSTATSGSGPSGPPGAGASGSGVAVARTVSLTARHGSPVPPADAGPRAKMPSSPAAPRGKLQSFPPNEPNSPSPPPPSRRSYPPGGPPRPRSTEPQASGWNATTEKSRTGEDVPNTQRLGSQPAEGAPGGARPGSLSPRENVAMYRPDTTYSFVDRSSRSQRPSKGETAPPPPAGAPPVAPTADRAAPVERVFRPENVPSVAPAVPAERAVPAAVPAERPAVPAERAAAVVPAERPVVPAAVPAERPAVPAEKLVSAPPAAEPVVVVPPAGPAKNAPAAAPPVETAERVEVMATPRAEVKPAPERPAAMPSPLPPAPPAGQSWRPRGIKESTALVVPRSEPKGPPMVDVRPVSPSWRGAPDLERDGPSPELQALRDQLIEHGSKQCFVVGIAGDPTASAAKATIAARLATMLSNDRRARILLVEADFEYPTMHELTGVDMPAGAGFSQQLRRRIRGSERKPWIVVRCAPTLDVLVEGSLRSPGVLFSQEFADAIRELRRSYDIIVIDAPLIGGGIEHKPIDSVTDGLVVVGRRGDELSEVLDRTARRFQQKALVAAVHAEAATSRPPPAAH